MAQMPEEPLRLEGRDGLARLVTKVESAEGLERQHADYSAAGRSVPGGDPRPIT